MVLTFASLFTGMGGADLGAMQAGLKPIWGIEINPAIANLAQTNFPDCQIIKGDVGVFKFCYSWLDRPDWLHASPPCINASRAKNGKETSHDIYLAKGICEAIAVLKPEYFSLENVAGYFHYDSFLKIDKLLRALRYHFSTKIFDCAQYGIPQSRKRLFLVASKNPESVYRIDRVTNRIDENLVPILDDIRLAPVVSWKEAIADLIPYLTPTNLTGWQSQALQDCERYWAGGKHWHGLDENNEIPDVVIQRSGARKKDGIPNNTIRLAHQPMFTVKAMSGTQRPSVKQATIVIGGQPYEADTRCLARWQTIPDSYELSGNLILDTMAIGNAVPPLMLQKIITSTLNNQ